MSEKEKVTVHVNVKMTSEALQSIVNNAKKIIGPSERGYYKIDTADKVGEMISRFLEAYDFEGYVKNIENYPR